MEAESGFCCFQRRGFHGIGTGWVTCWCLEKDQGLDGKGSQIPHRPRCRLKGPAKRAVALTVELLVKCGGPRAGLLLESESWPQCTPAVGTGAYDLISAPPVFPVKWASKGCNFFRANIGEAPKWSCHQYIVRLFNVFFNSEFLCRWGIDSKTGTLM